MESERQDTLKDNEEHFAKGGVDSASDSDGGDAMDNDYGDELENSDEEWKEQQRLFAKLGPKLSTGKKLTAAEMDEFGLGDDDDDDDDDEDYEYGGGDDALYDSAVDEIDELKFLRDTIGLIQTQDPQRFTVMMQGITKPDQRSKFEAIMVGVDALTSREADITQKLKELAKKQGKI